MTSTQANSLQNLPRVLVVADHASAVWGGEAVLPLHIFRGLRRIGCEAWLCVGAETRAELDALLGDDRNRVHYVPVTAAAQTLKAWEQKAPAWLPRYFFFFARELLMQRAQASIVRTLADSLRIDIIHQPMPVSPRLPSFLTNLPAPLVIGPLNGAMEYPPDFRFLQRPLARALKAWARLASPLFHALAPGKRQAALILVANNRTARALPGRRCGEVATMIENGVDPDLWTVPDTNDAPDVTNPSLNLVFLGRLERWKGVEWLIRALPIAARTTRFHLTVIGDFEAERSRLAALAAQLNINHLVTFTGYQAQTQAAAAIKTCDALVLPSVYECGGAVVLEAMAASKPVIAVAWGGPADYLNDQTGILVPVSTPDALVLGLAGAIEKLGRMSVLARRAMGRAARDRCLAHFAWPRKIDQLLGFYARLRTENR